MPNMLDYERLVRRVADLEVENKKIKGHYRMGEDDRWNIIEEQPEVGTFTEEKRLRRVIRDWEERYDILCELFMNRDQHKASLDWYDAKMELEIRRRKQAEERAKTERRIMWIRTAYTKIKTIWILIKRKMK
jgi:hypothetical protein